MALIIICAILILLFEIITNPKLGYIKDDPIKGVPEDSEGEE